MNNLYTNHAAVRARQRGIPPMVDQLLDQYGKEEFDGHGAITVYFDKQGIRAMEHELGRRPVSRFSEWFGVYKIRSIDGKTITLGHRTRRVWRK